MHVAADLNWFLQFIVLALLGAFALLYLVRNTASRYFVVDSTFDSPAAADYSSLDRRKRDTMAEAAGGAAEGFGSCAVCGLLTKKFCAGCKITKYCSASCQKSHWDSEHKNKCQDLQSVYKNNYTKPKSGLRGRKTSAASVGATSKICKQSNKILFPYEEFLEFFNWEKAGYPPCGLLNCGNSCFANVVLQCLAFTRPLVAYLLEKGHKIECQRDDWCFLCEFQLHVERASRSLHPFSPMNILSRLPNIGGNLGYGKQEDAHEFMRFAIDTMQSVCLDEYGGEKAVHPIYQETTLIQHIFGGHLRSQVICAECNNISDQFENMMDLTVEIHGDAGSLEECLDQFTAKERLHGDNMYKCDGCNAYVMAWKRLTLQRAPNILTIALKRFQSGRFGKLNKRVSFPETLNLRPYMSELEDGNDDVYNLYAVIVHVDMLNASFFGHYICYVKDFRGNWYRVDDCKVSSVDLEEVLSQGAYMLLYSRIRARPSCLLSKELLTKEGNDNDQKITEVDSSRKEPTESLSDAVSIDSPVDSEQSLSADDLGFEVNVEDLSSTADAAYARADIEMVSENVELCNGEGSTTPKDAASPIKFDNEPCSTNTSSIAKTSAQLDVEDAKCGAESNGKVTVESTIADNCTFEEASTTCNVSAMATTSAEVPEKVKPPNSTSMHENVRSSSLNTQNGAKKSNGGGSAAKCKPLFTPGFLGKHPRKISNKVEKKVSPKSHVSNTNEAAECRSFCETNGGLLKEDMPHILLENGNINGKASVESDICKSLENGESAIEI